MRIAKPGALGGSHSIKQVTGSCLGGVWFYAESVRGTVKRIYLSWSEMDQINEAIRDAKKEAAARTSRQARVNDVWLKEPESGGPGGTGLEGTAYEDA